MEIEEGPVALLAQHAALVEAIKEGRPGPSGRLLGLPELDQHDVWVDIAGAAALVRVMPSTITSWLARGGPKRGAFPRPQRLLYRLYWRRSVIEAWLADASRPGDRGYRTDTRRALARAELR
jgi:predicted DNA-binding transcriptional regulator AlpA